jgi:hypothetical protein
VRARPPAATTTVGDMTKWEYATVPGPNNPEQLVAYLKRERSA